MSRKRVTRINRQVRDFGRSSNSYNYPNMFFTWWSKSQHFLDAICHDKISIIFDTVGCEFCKRRLNQNESDVIFRRTDVMFLTEPRRSSIHKFVFHLPFCIVCTTSTPCIFYAPSNLLFRPKWRVQIGYFLRKFEISHRYLQISFVNGTTTWTAKCAENVNDEQI